MYVALFETFCVLLSLFFKPEFVRRYKEDKLQKCDIVIPDNYPMIENMFVGAARNSLDLLYHDGDSKHD